MSRTFEKIDLHRRHLLGAAVTAAAGQLGMLTSTNAQSAEPTLPLIKPGTYVSLGPLKHINAGLLNVAYAEAGPADGPPVILLHGWPYDIHSFVDVTPLLASAGYRVLVPYLRGYGVTRFLSRETFRNGQPSALAVDVIDFMDALKIEKALLAGFDWGARSANIVAALWQERVKALIAVSGYLIGSQEAGKMPLPLDGDSVWPKASPNTTSWKSGSPDSRSSRCPQSLCKAMPMAHHARTPLRMRRNFPDATSTDTLPEASATTCRRKRRRASPRLSWTSPQARPSQTMNLYAGY